MFLAIVVFVSILAFISGSGDRDNVYFGNLWTAKKVGETYIVSLKDKSSIYEALTDFINKQKIRGGQVTGIGAVNEATLRYYNPATKTFVDKTFQEQMELTSVSGNVAEIAGALAVHLHVTLGRSDYSIVGGHLRDAYIRGAGELFFYPLNSKIVKTKDNVTGLNLYNFTIGSHNK